MRQIVRAEHKIYVRTAPQAFHRGEGGDAPLGLTMRELCPWYAITVKHQHEQSVRSLLEFKGFDVLVPTYRGCRRWSDRLKELELPVFAGYAFCRFPYPERIRVLDTPGVVKVVSFGGCPAEVPDEEIAAIQTAIA